MSISTTPPYRRFPMQDVSESGVVAHINQRMHTAAASRSDQLGSFAVGVTNIPKDPSFGTARLHTRRVLTALNEMRAHRALFDDTLFLVKVAHPVGASHCAVTTTDALVLVNEDNPIGALLRRPRWADGDALGILAVLAQDREIVLLQIWEFPHWANTEYLVPV
jgi:hypothetical protein